MVSADFLRITHRLHVRVCSFFFMQNAFFHHRNETLRQYPVPFFLNIVPYR